MPPDLRVAAASWGWFDTLSPSALRRAGLVSLQLLTNSHRWVHRRVERISLADHKTAHHQISVDFSLPYGVPPIGRLDGQDIYLAPLFLIMKEGLQDLTTPDYRPVPVAPYSNLGLVNHIGHRLPLTTRQQGRDIAAQVLSLRARQLIPGFENDDELISMVGGVALADSRQRAPALDYLLHATAGHGDRRTLLRRDPIFRELAYALAFHSLIPCWFIGMPRPRYIVKLSYDEEVRTTSLSTEEAVRRFLGFKSELCHIQLNEIGASASYHVEVEIPSELQLNEIGLIGERYEYGYMGLPSPLGRLARVWNALRQRKPPPRDQYGYYVRQSDRASRGHIYIPNPDGRRVGAVWVKLRMRQQGFLTGALLAAVVTSTVLTVFWAKADSIGLSQLSNTAIALLLLIPSFLAGYIARPGEHAIASRMLRATRAALIVDAALPFAAGVRLLTVSAHDPDPSATLVGTWSWLALVSYLFVIWFAICNVLPRPHGQSRYFLSPRPRHTYMIESPPKQESVSPS